MSRLLRKFANPFGRTALMAFAWSHRRTIMRWGRSFWTELRKPGSIDSDRLRTIGSVLWAITRDDELAGAKQLRQVRLDGNVLVVDTAPGWRGTARLVDELDDVAGVSAITDTRGNVLAGTVSARAA
jgi:hypothetical protein